MTAKLTLALFAAGLFARTPAEWIRDGNAARDRGAFAEAAADFSQALQSEIDQHACAGLVAHLRVTLATAYMEAGAYREAESALQDAQMTTPESSSELARAERLNAWSALHLKLGQLAPAESELREAVRISTKLPDTGDLPAIALHNLAAVEMRTGRYTEAFGHESEAVRRFEQNPASDPGTLIRGWASLGALQYMMAKPREARTSMEHAIHLAENTYGPSHGLIADLLLSDAVVLEKLRLHQEARRARDRARKISSAQTAATAGNTSWNVHEPAAPGQVHLYSK